MPSRSASALLAKVIRLSGIHQAPKRPSISGGVACSWLIAHNTLEERTRLWEKLRNIARDHRGGGWDCDLPKLAALLRQEFRLTKWPCDVSELALLRNESQGSWDQISDKLGSDCYLPVSHIQREIDAALTMSSVIVLEGAIWSW